MWRDPHRENRHSRRHQIPSVRNYEGNVFTSGSTLVERLHQATVVALQFRLNRWSVLSQLRVFKPDQLRVAAALRPQIPGRSNQQCATTFSSATKALQITAKDSLSHQANMAPDVVASTQGVKGQNTMDQRQSSTLKKKKAAA